MKQYLIIHKKQEWEIFNPYSIVDEDTLKTINMANVHATKEVEDRLYSKEELEAIRDSLI